MRATTTGLLIVILALTGCANESSLPMAQVAQRNGDSGFCRNAFDKQNLGARDFSLTPSGFFAKCMSDRGWTKSSADDHWHWVRRIQDPLASADPAGQCGFTYTAEIRDSLVLPSMQALGEPPYWIWVPIGHDTGRILRATFSPAAFDLGTPNIERKNGWVVLTFYPRQRVYAGPDVEIALDPCQGKVVRSELQDAI